MTTPTEEERKHALERLDSIAAAFADSPERSKFIAVIKAMLAEPRLPAVLDDRIKRQVAHEMMKGTWLSVEGQVAMFHQALYAHLSAPQTKEVGIWRVEFADKMSDGYWTPLVQTFLSQHSATHEAARLVNNPARYACIRVTGPHKQQVPA